MDYYSAVRTFVRVAETGSFTKTSDQLELPRNAVTKLIQALEAHLQVKLFNRTTRRVSLTTDGAAYFERMSRVMQEWQEAESDLAMSQHRPRGRVRVDMASLIAAQLVIPALPAFYERYPDIQLDIGVSLTFLRRFPSEAKAAWLTAGAAKNTALNRRKLVANRRVKTFISNTSFG